MACPANDPEPHLKTAAYLDDLPPPKIPAGRPVTTGGLVISDLLAGV